MRRLFIALAFIVVLILQTTILPFLRIGGVMPDLLLVLVIFTALFYGSLAGGVVGFAVGLAQDLIGGPYLGLGALSIFLAGYLMGYLERRVNKDNLLVAFSLVLVGSFMAGAFYLLGQGLLDMGSLNMRLFWRVMAPGALYNACLAVLLFNPLTRLFGGSVQSRVEIVQPGKMIYR
ncbi:MAG: rod shape-determining protein MreD [Thermacetogeniaceae bacterium]